MSDVCFFVDRHSFPKKCGELYDFLSLVQDDYPVFELDCESPTTYFKKALELTDQYELIVPVTRNMFVRDRLRMEGVNLVVCL